MLPPPASPAPKPPTTWTIRVPRNTAFTILRNNLGGLGAILLLNWFFPIYPRLKRILLPPSWQETLNITELVALAVFFGFNVLAALVSIRYPRPPYPPLRTPVKPPPPPNNTPVRLPVKDLGTSPLAAKLLSRKSLGSSGYASTPLSSQSRYRDFSVSSVGSPLKLNHSGTSSLYESKSANSSPLAAYMGRHPRASGRPVDFQILRDLTVDDDDDDEQTY